MATKKAKEEVVKTAPKKEVKKTVKKEAAPKKVAVKKSLRK